MDQSPFLSARHARWLGADRGGALVDEVDGTLVFADVSGFTALSERLARRGTAGAEELTDLINAVVGGLLRAAEPFGADLLKYGGDALALLFEGDDHRARAAAAAAAMQASMRAFRRHRSESGAVTLRMSVGVGSGPFHLFLVGHRHRELVVAGLAASAVVGLEHDADAGEVLLANDLAAALPARHRGAAKGSGVLLRGAPAAPAAVGSTAVVAPDGLTGIPVALRSHLGLGVDGEHRLATVAFVQHRGVDELVAAGRVDDAAFALDALVVAAQEACERHGTTFLATDVDAGGGKLILVAGVPTASASDEDRLLLAVSEILAADVPLQVRAGVHRGRLFSVEVGDGRRRVPTVLGDAVNLAARVMGAAPVGRALVTDSTWERVGTPWERTPVPPFAVKGKSEPVQASLAGDVVERPRSDGERDHPLVGRMAELDRILAVVRAPLEDKFAAIELVGEAGIGKSRLVAAAIDAAEGLPTVVVEGTQYGSTQAYRALREPLRSLLGVGMYDDDAAAAALSATVRDLAPDLEPRLPALAVPFGLTSHLMDVTTAVEPAFRTDQIQMLSLQLFDHLLPERGLLVVEDAFWLDPSSGDLVSRLVAFLARTRSWAVVVASRPLPTPVDLSDVPGIERLDLGPLDRDDAAALAMTKVPDEAVPPAVMAALVERSGGNPLYLGELAAALARGSSVEDLPDSIEGVVAASVDAVPATERALLRAASVLGSRFPPGLLATMLDEREDVVISQLTAAARLVGPDDEQLRFTHDLVRQVAYEGLSFRRRRELHGRAADAIEHAAGDQAETGAAQLALHSARSARWDAAWRWARIAGDRAAATGSPGEALALYEAALDAGRRVRADRLERADVFAAAGDAALTAGRPARSLELVASGRHLAATDPGTAANLLRVAANARQSLGRYPQVSNAANRIRRLADAMADEDEAEAWRRRADYFEALSWIYRGKSQRAHALLEGIVAWDGQSAVTPRAMAVLEADASWPGPRGRALEWFERDGDDAGIADASLALGATAYYAGRWTEAAAHYQRAAEAATRAGVEVLAALARLNAVQLLIVQGRIGDATALVDDALATLRYVTDRRSELFGRILRADVLSARGHFAEADEAFDMITPLVAHAGDLASQVAEARLERCLLAAETDTALAILDGMASPGVGTGGKARRWRARGWALAQLGDYEAALDALRLSLSAADTEAIAFEAALTREAIVRVRRAQGEDVPDDAEAVAIFERLGVVWTSLPPVGDLPARLYS